MGGSGEFLEEKIGDLGGGDFGAFHNKTNHWGHSFSVSMPPINALWDKMLI